MADGRGAQLARDYFEAFQASDREWWQAHIAPDFVRHDPGLPFEVRGPDGVARLYDYQHGGFGDIALVIDDTVEEGDRVLARLRFQGTHSGPFEGAEPTGRRIEAIVMDLFRFDGDRLVEHWALMDNLSMLKQIGAVDA